MITRRTLLTTFTLFPLAACATPTTSAPSTTPTATTTTPERHDELFELERKFDARLGVYAMDTGDGKTIAHRADERFAFCSTFKGLATAGVLHRNPMTHLEAVVTYTEADLMKSSAITKRHVATGIKIRDLCDAAVRVWPPDKKPLLIAIMPSKSTADAKYDEALIAEAAAYVVKTLT